MGTRSNRLTKGEAVFVEAATTKQAKKHLRSIAGSGDKSHAGQPQSFELPSIETKSVPAAPPSLSTDQAAGMVFGEKLVACATSADANFADYVRQLVGKPVDFLTSVDGVVSKHLRHEREQIDQLKDQKIGVIDATTDLTPAAARKSKAEIMNWAQRRKASVNNGRLVQIKQILAAMTTSRTDLAFDWKQCKSFADFLAEAKRSKSTSSRKFVPLTASGFKSWSDKMKRIVDVGNYEPESEKSADQLARLEKMVQTALTQYLKVAEKIPTLSAKASVIEKTLVAMLK